MKTGLVFALLALVTCNHTAFAGLATFTPTNLIVLGTGNMDVTLTSQELPEFNSADLIIASEVPFEWHYSPEFLSKSGALYPPTPIANDNNLIELYVGGVASLAANNYGKSIFLGTLTVDDYDLGPGAFRIFVNSDFDGNSNISLNGVTEGLTGSGMIYTHVPEPTTSMILMVGMIVTVGVRKRMT